MAETRADATNRRERSGGFTLVELLVVIVILGVLSGVVVFAVSNLTSQAAATYETRDEHCREEVPPFKQIAVSTGIDSADVLYGLDSRGRVWAISIRDKGRWHRVTSETVE
jgi:prepilin-type N-terminal cleavage/methylation domain-containing protein